METSRKLQIVTALKQQIEDAIEIASIELRICNKAKDEAGAKAAKERAMSFETKLAELAVIEEEAKAEQKT